MITAKRTIFARAYALSGNATQSAVDAGYSPKTAKQQGSRLLTYVDVRAEIERLQRERWEAEAVDREWVVRQLVELAENAKTDAARIRALELLGKSLGMFREQVEVHATHDVSVLKQYSVTELLTMRETALRAAPEAIEA